MKLPTDVCPCRIWTSDLRVLHSVCFGKSFWLFLVICLGQYFLPFVLLFSTWCLIFVVYLVWSLYELDGMLFPIFLISAQRTWLFLFLFIVSIDLIMVW